MCFSPGVRIVYLFFASGERSRVLRRVRLRRRDAHLFAFGDASPKAKRDAQEGTREIRRHASPSSPSATRSDASKAVHRRCYEAIDYKHGGTLRSRDRSAESRAPRDSALLLR